MKIYNQNKTQELNESELDMSLGYLKPDKIVTAHHEATPATKGRSAAEVAAELKAQGKPVIEIGGQPYIVTHIYKDGKEIPISPELDLSAFKNKSVTKIEAEPDTPAKEAYDDEENIMVYIPYTEAELKELADKKLSAELKAELAKIKEDIEQETFGLVRGDYAEKKARAAEIINELRVLEGKEPRKVTK